MKRLYTLLVATLLCGGMLMAQGPVNRTPSTIVADVLAQMPAKEQKNYNNQMKDLCAAGEAGVLMLVDQMKAPGKGSNALVEYALTGLTNYVTGQGEESNRTLVANAFVKALAKTNERETKAFIIRQLEVLKQDVAVAALASYLNNESLCGPAARALGATNTESSNQALLNALQSTSNQKVKENVIRALADSQYTPAESAVLAEAGKGDFNYQSVVYYTLSRLGGESSLNTLAKAAADAGYTLSKNGANEYYIQLLKRLVAQGNTKTVQKAATNLLKAAGKAGALQTREAATEVLFAVDGANNNTANAVKTVVNALKDDSKDYRNAVLKYASSLANEDMYVKVLKATQKAAPAVKADVYDWIGREAQCPKKHDIIKNLSVMVDLPLKQLLQNELGNADYDVVESAATALTRIGDASSIASLANLLTSADDKAAAYAGTALAAFPGNVNSEVAKAIDKANAAGKIAGLNVLGLRKANANLGTVVALTKSQDNAVKTKAYETLKEVVSGQDFTAMCGMLEETTDQAAIVPLQQAIVATLAGKKPAEQIQSVKRRMNQAGNKNYLYFPVLASTGEQEALDTIVENLKSNNQQVKDAAFAALLNWNDIRSLGNLYDICKTTTSSDVLNKTLNRYIELATSPALTGENQLIYLRKAMDIAKTDQQKNEVLKKVEKTGTFLALLYAGEYLDNKPVQQSAAQAVMNIAMAHKEYYGDNVRALLQKTSDVLDNPDAGYERERIKKHLEEMPAGKGFVPIFNGKDLTGWKGLVEDPIKRAKMKPAALAKAQKAADETMRKNWKAEDGCLVYHGTGFDNLCTVKQYGDFEMYVDWMLDPAGPEADAGIYLRGTPQVQIWDIARVNVGAQVGSGGLYNNKTHEDKPLTVADNKLGEWNSFYIKMVGDRVTVLLNGVKVVDNVIMENYWDRSQPIPALDQIELQAHGSKVYFRNIYVNELERKEPFKLSAEEEKEGFKILFDGTNMHEWTGNTQGYVLDDGCIYIQPGTHFGGNLYTKDEYENFIYRFEFQNTPGGNNGVGIRTPMEGDAAYVGMEIQILDCEHPIYKNITKLQHHGSVYGIIPARDDHPKAFKPAGEWNTEEIMADGDHIRVTVNGVVILDGNIREATVNGTADHKKHPGLFNKKGHIGFLGHGSVLRFRNIRIKELK